MLTSMPIFFCLLLSPHFKALTPFLRVKTLSGGLSPLLGGLTPIFGDRMPTLRLFCFRILLWIGVQAPSSGQYPTWTFLTPASLLAIITPVSPPKNYPLSPATNSKYHLRQVVVSCTIVTIKLIHHHPCIIQNQSIHTLTNWLQPHLPPKAVKKNPLQTIPPEPLLDCQNAAIRPKWTYLLQKPILLKHDYLASSSFPFPSTPTCNHAPTPIFFLSIYLTHSWTLLDKLASLTPPFKNPKPQRYVHVYLLQE